MKIGAVTSDSARNLHVKFILLFLNICTESGARWLSHPALYLGMGQVQTLAPSRAIMTEDFQFSSISRRK